MRIPVLFVILSLALAGLCAGSAFADGHRENNHEIAAAVTAKISLAEAADAAERHTGGRALGAGITRHQNSPAYEVKIAEKGVLALVLVSLETGKVLRVEHSGPLGRAAKSAELAAFFKDNPAAGGLTAVIWSAERAQTGQALEADYSTRDRLYEVEILAPDRSLHSIHVDPATLKVVKTTPGESEEVDE